MKIKYTVTTKQKYKSHFTYITYFPTFITSNDVL
jgi:hypothetical protein